MKNATLLLTILLSSIYIQAQDLKNESEKSLTKMDVFASKTGIITKFTDSNLNGIKSSYGLVSETRIRKVNSGEFTSYFYQIEKQGKYGSSTASIEYSDLLELIKALDRLKLEESNDILSNSDYLENKFVTEDGFQVGYFVRKGKSKWYIRLEKYGSDKTLFIKNVEIIGTSFEEAKEMIDTLKKI